MIVRKEMAFEPIAEFRKLTASLLTPTTMSIVAKTVMAININIYILSIVLFCTISANIIIFLFLSVN